MRSQINSYVERIELANVLVQKQKIELRDLRLKKIDDRYKIEKFKAKINILKSKHISEVI